MMVGGGCTVATNTLDDNQWPTDLLPPTTLGTGTGLLVTGQGCLIMDNTLRGNFDANIRVKSTHNAIENNLVTGAKYGIYFEEIGNFYANNRASGNTTNYMKAPSSNSPGDGGGNASF
jgi:parallel beta-helix repeat protein